MQSYAHINEERVISLHALTHWARFREEKINYFFLRINANFRK